MAAKSKGFDGDGLRREGTESGQLRYFARITARHPDTGDKFLDTVRKILASSKGEALTKRNALRDELLAKKLGRIGKVKRIKLADALSQYIATISRYSTNQNYRSYGKAVTEHFGDRWLDSLEIDECQRYVTGLAKKYQRPTIGGHRSVIVGVFGWAIEEGLLRAPNPMKDLQVVIRKDAQKTLRRLSEKPDKRSLRRDELPRFLAAMESIDRVAHLIMLSQFALGCRFAEVSGLQRTDIDWQTGEVDIIRGQVSGHEGPPKADKSRAAAFPPSVLEKLRGHVAEMDRLKWPGYETWLFPRRPDTKLRSRRLPVWVTQEVNAIIRQAKAAAGVHTVNGTHLARHTMISLVRAQLADQAARDASFRDFVGHDSEQQHERYGEAPVFAIARAMEKRLSGADSASEEDRKSRT